MKFSTRDWIWFTICAILALYVITDSIRANKLREQLDDLKVFTLSVQAIDQETGHPTDSISVSPHLNVRQNQIMRLWRSVDYGQNSISFEYIGTPPFTGTISVTNAGYEEKTVSFDSAHNQLVVYLTHKI